MMKYGIGAVALILGGLIAWYVFSNNPGPETTESVDSTNPENKSQLTEGTSSTTTTNAGAVENSAAGGPTSPLKVEGHKVGDGVTSDSGTEEENDEEDYGEPVSKEDFKDFITTALDELAEDETTALAIIKEMDKIARAQPAHEEEVARFYRECAKRPKVSPKVQEACQQAMRDKGL
ncbi:MAG: hypothetical protein A2X86_02280 [Bdellovibrionales bacterium GWA2_49_15]|nr:MAG: hypothetical protein A2X86_02280 [Bdellovibrionales bacterium GWA2_49_15]